MVTMKVFKCSKSLYTSHGGLYNITTLGVIKESGNHSSIESLGLQNLMCFVSSRYFIALRYLVSLKCLCEHSTDDR